MRRINVAEDIVPVAELGSHATELLEQLHETRRPIVITRDGKPAAVMITPEEFEELEYRDYVTAKVREGLESAEREPTVSLDEARKRLTTVIRQVEQGGGPRQRGR